MIADGLFSRYFFMEMKIRTAELLYQFYGDVPGKADWKIDERTTDWVTITSTKGKPVWIFANKPLYGEDDPDEKAQDKLIEYLYSEI